MMKFYYKGQLVRTSKTHDYKWAVVEEKDDGSFEVYGCRSKREAAESEMRYWLLRGHWGVRVVHLDKEPNPVGLTYEEFIALAEANYNNGGDGYVECWDEHTFDCYVRDFGAITESGALMMFDRARDEEREERAMIAAMKKSEW